jgi:hypothetical protein
LIRGDASLGALRAVAEQDIDFRVNAPILGEMGIYSNQLAEGINAASEWQVYPLKMPVSVEKVRSAKSAGSIYSLLPVNLRNHSPR